MSMSHSPKDKVCACRKMAKNLADQNSSASANYSKDVYMTHEYPLLLGLSHSVAIPNILLSLIPSIMPFGKRSIIIKIKK